jgi:methyl-accepting chemotaxis protein
MKNTFSVRRLATIMIFTAVIVAIINIMITIWLTTALQKNQAAALIISEANDKAHEVQFNVAQVQQFLTDVGATSERAGFDEAEAHFKTAQTLLDNLDVLQPQSKALFDTTRIELQALYDTGKQMAEEYIAHGQKAGNLVMKQPQTGFDDRSAALISSMAEFVNPLVQENAAIQKEIAFKIATLKNVITLMNILSALTFGLAMMYFGRKLFSYLGGEPVQAQQTANIIANGDLSVDVPVQAGDETSLLASMHKMQQNLRSLIWQIKQSAEDINIGAQQIAAGNTDLSQRTEEQASSLEETASSMEEMASTVKQNAENAKKANLMATEASAVATKGGEAVGQVVNTMADINASSKKIVDIISVIDGIAFQTNILALNAAVEAARAGEQGRGFAVVAAEVRSLAQRSATAAKEIKQLIGDSVEKVASGTKQVQAAGETMGEIVIAVNMVTDIVNEIAAASFEQSAGIDQVNNAITSMDEVTQQNAALVEEAAAAAHSLEDKAHDLIDSTSKFKLAEDSYASTESNVQQKDAHLNEMRASINRELPNPKSAKLRKHLKAPKTNKSEDWEEF